jgi:hypothetical protein
VTLEIAKQKLDQATGAAVDLSSVFSTMESSMESAFMSMVDGTMSQPKMRSDQWQEMLSKNFIVF